MQLDVDMLYINDFVAHNPDVILIQFRLQETDEIGCFLGAHVAVQSMRVHLGGES